MKADFSFLCLVLTMLVASAPGCCTMRNALSDANVMAARDLTFHGMNALHQGELEQAEDLLGQAVEACPTDQRIRQHLASAMVQQGKIDSAIQHLETAIRQSQDSRLYVELGNLYLTKQQPYKALDCAIAALKTNRQDPSAWVLRGKCEQAMNDGNAALASFHRAASIDDADPEAHFLIARSYRNAGKSLQALNALEVYNEHFAADQVPMEAVLLMADTLVDLKQNHRAQEQLARATRRQDATPESYLALSRIQSRSGDHTGAMTTAQNAVTVFPENSQIRVWTRSLEQQGQGVGTGNRTAGLPRSNGYQ